MSLIDCWLNFSITYYFVGETQGYFSNHPDFCYLTWTIVIVMKTNVGQKETGQKETRQKETRQKETGQKVLYLGQKVFLWNLPWNSHIIWIKLFKHV